jgi:hypothetical protein
MTIRARDVGPGTIVTVSTGGMQISYTVLDVSLKEGRVEMTYMAASELGTTFHSEKRMALDDVWILNAVTMTTPEQK